MKYFFLLFLTSFSLAVANPIVEERHQLFTLAVLKYLDKNPNKDGHDIAALLAWEVENIHITPEFVLDHNRNYEKQGNLFHAEIMTMEKALAKKWQAGLSDEEIHKQHSIKLINATLYSSLEPCPFCSMGITWARIPKAIYFMEDPQMRDLITNELKFSLPKEVFGKKLTKFELSSLPLAKKLNQEQRAECAKDNGAYIIQKDGKKDFNLYRYRLDNIRKWLRIAREEFDSYQVIYQENEELFERLKQELQK